MAAIGSLFFFPARPAQATVTPVAGVTVHSAGEVSANFISRTGHGLVFHCPQGGDWDLAETPAELGNTTGDGSFHPMKVEDVVDALRGVDYSLAGADFHIYILPFPRRSDPGSAAAGRAMFLSPGIREYSSREAQFVATHETGHLVQYAWMPDGDTELWERYKSMRGIDNPAVYNPSATHADRPHEIFAEDFRFLFGDPTANYSGGIENANLPLPTVRPELRQFFASLRVPAAARVKPMLALSNGPNPFASKTMISFVVAMPSASPAGSQAALAAGEGRILVTLEIFSADGRMVRKLVDGQYVSGTYRVSFDATGQAGEPLSRGIYFARLRGGGGDVTRKLVLTP